MTAVLTLHAGVLALLRAIPNVTIYDGEVPDRVPSDTDGRAYPYVVLWPSAGARPEESRALEPGYGGDLRWTAELTVASGWPSWTLTTVTLVRRALDGQILSPFSGPLEEDPSVVAPPLLRDRDVPVDRHYVPLTYVTTTG